MLVVIVQIPAFFSSVLLGGYSDATGRKLATIPPLVGAAARLLTLLAIILFDLHPGFLILSSLVDGFGGGVCTMLMASFSYIASITGTQSRSLRVIIVEVCSGLALVTSLLSVGYSVDVLGYAWTYIILLGVVFTALCYVVFILPEASPISATTTAYKANFFTTKHFTRTLALYVKDDADGSGRHWKLRLTLLLLVITSAVQLGSFDVMVLFLLSAPLCFTAEWIGYFFAFTQFIENLTSLIVTHVFVRHAGDLILIVVGLLFGIGNQLMFGLSTNRVMLFMGKYICSYLFLSGTLVRLVSLRFSGTVGWATGRAYGLSKAGC